MFIISKLRLTCSNHLLKNLVHVAHQLANTVEILIGERTIRNISSNDVGQKPHAICVSPLSKARRTALS